MQSNLVKIREDKNQITFVILKSEIYFALIGDIISLIQRALVLIQINWFYLNKTDDAPNKGEIYLRFEDCESDPVFIFDFLEN